MKSAIWATWKMTPPAMIVGRNKRIAMGVLIASGVLGYLSPSILHFVMGKSAQEWMGITYPVLTAAVGTSSVLMFLYWRYVYSIKLVLAIAFLLLTEAVALGVLTVSTGPSPIFDINELRIFVVWARLLMLSASATVNLLCVLILADHIASKRKIIDFYMEG